MIVEPILAGTVAGVAIHNFERWWRRRRRKEPPAIATPKPPIDSAHPVLVALRRAGRPLFNRELAELMGCSEGEASKRRREVEHLVRTFKRGRRLYVALAS